MPPMPGMPGPGPVVFNLHDLLTRWQLSPFPLAVMVALIALAFWYLRAHHALTARGRRWPRSQTVAFLSGLVAVDLAIQSPIATLAGGYFEVHVIQHLLLMVVAPLLLALGAPSTMLLQTSSRRVKSRWLAFLRSGPFAILSHPLSAWALYFGIMYLFFLTPLINLSMHHMDLMDVMNLTFLLGGTLYWWPMMAIDPIVHWKMTYGARMLNILLGTGIEAFLGTAILMSRHPEASMYSLSSTHAGGGLLWASTEVVTLAAFVPIYLKWVRSEERSAGRFDLQASHRTARAAAMALAPASASASSSAPAPASGSDPLRRDDPMTPWEAEWLARTGSVPRRD